MDIYCINQNTVGMTKKKSISQLPYQLIKTGLLSTLFLICFAAIAHAGDGFTEDILNKKISLSADQREVKDILVEISKQAEIKFVYSAQKIPVRKKVSLEVRDQRLGDVLNNLLQPLEVLYYVSGNQIVLMKKGQENSFVAKQMNSAPDKEKVPEKENLFKNITGKVTNEKGEAMEGVSVLVRGTNRGTTTNSTGNFTINAEVGETLDFSMVGYKNFSVKMTGWDDPLL